MWRDDLFSLDSLAEEKKPNSSSSPSSGAMGQGMGRAVPNYSQLRVADMQNMSGVSFVAENGWYNLFVDVTFGLFVR